jgi:hypothetical protein
MKVSHSFTTFAVVALLLPGLRAAAETDAAASGTKPEEATEEKTEAAAKPAGTVEAKSAAEPAEPVETTSPEPTAGPYVPFAPTPTPLRLESSSASIQFGVLGQPQFEVSGAPDADLTTKNLFVRRFRFTVAGTLFKTLEFFFQTDWPNLFKLDPADTMAFDKNAPGLNIQDAYVTYRPFGAHADIARVFDVKLDAGFMLPPLSHNSLESAAKLYGADYFVNSFRRNVTNNADPFRAYGQSPVGRDAGVQLRVLALNGHIDFRVGTFMGRRVGAVPASASMPAVVGGINVFRLSARLQINLLDAEPGFFYQGTYLGARKIVSLGAFVDYQDPYKYFGADLLVDLPVGPGIFTAQGGVVQWDGGTFIPLVKQRVYMAEVGYLIGPVRLSPIARFERLDSPLIPNPDPAMPGLIPDASNPSEDRYGGGLAFWPYGHNSNLKVFFTRVHRTPAPHDFNVITAQWQVSF